ncbi:MAG: MaoC family dehydratase [Chloroflexi bacterium]|nr:MaoC family dehydratase [Chloroflexota bacterium]
MGGEAVADVLGVKVGDRAEFRKTVTRDDIVRFAEVTGDANPLHLDEAYAGRTRFGRNVAHGILSAGFISAALGTKLAPNCCVIYLSQSLRFLRPVFIGDEVRAVVEAKGVDPQKRIVTVKTECYNQDGEPVVTGEAVVLLDPAPQ